MLGKLQRQEHASAMHLQARKREQWMHASVQLVFWILYSPEYCCPRSVLTAIGCVFCITYAKNKCLGCAWIGTSVLHASSQSSENFEKESTQRLWEPEVGEDGWNHVFWTWQNHSTHEFSAGVLGCTKPAQHHPVSIAA